LRRRSTRMTGAEIAEVPAMPITTVQGILTRLGLGKLSRLEREQVVRYERSRPGELVHIDVKKLGRIERGAGHRVPAASTTRASSRTPLDENDARPVGSSAT